MLRYHHSTLSYNEMELRRLYKSLCNNDPASFLHDVGTENITIDEAAGDDTSIWSQLIGIIKNVKKLMGHVLVGLSDSINRLLGNYERLMDKYYTELNSSEIDEVEASKISVSCVPYDVLQKRITAVNNLFSILNQMDRVLNARGTDVETPDIQEANKSLMEIGFDITSLNLIRKTSEAYKSDVSDQSLYRHRYTLSNIKQLISSLKGLHIDKYTSSSYTNTLQKKMQEASDKLIYNIRSGANAQDGTDNKIKLQRLWWCTHYVRAAYVISTDIVEDLIRICRAILSMKKNRG